MSRIIIIVALVCALSTIALGADIPNSVNVQGKLTDAAGDPVADGVHSVVFSIYDFAAGGTVHWSDTLDVTTAGGLFSIIIGQAKEIPMAAFDGANRWLGIAIEGEAEMEPRTRFTSLPYAYYAEYCDTSDFALNNGWVDEGTIVQLVTPSDDVLIQDDLDVNGDVAIVRPLEPVPVPNALVVRHRAWIDSLHVEDKISFGFDYNSGWQSLSEGNCEILSHGLGGDASKYVVIVDGRTYYDDAWRIHQANFGTSYCGVGCWVGLEWYGLTDDIIKVCRGNNDNQGNEKDWDQYRVRIIKNQ